MSLGSASVEPAPPPGALRRGTSEIAEGRQFLPGLVVERLGLPHLERSRVPLELVLEPPSKLGDGVRPFEGEVSSLPRVDAQVVELGGGGVDEMKLFASERPELAPTVMESGIMGLAVGDEIEALALAEGEGKKARSLNRRLRRKPHEIQNRRHEVDRANLGSDADPFRKSRRSNKEGDFHRGVVDEEPMVELAVVLESLPVVCHHHDYRRLIQRLPREPVEESSDELVHVNHFAIVEPVPLPRAAAPVGLRGLVGRMRIIEVQPGEERAGFRPAHPRERL